jgi:hypothetical protein
MKTANITLQQCINKLRELAASETVYVDQIPEVLQEDFRAFMVGKTYSMHQYIDKIMYQTGISYPVKWVMP